MKLGIALSGGGIRGIAHAGVLQALEEYGVKPNIIGGTSCGSLIASMYAIGYSPYHIYILYKRYAKTIAKSNSIPILSGIQSCISKKKIAFSGFNSGEKMEELSNEVAQRRGISKIEDIKMPIAIPAVDMISGKEVIFTNKIPDQKDHNKEYITDINIGRAIRASSKFHSDEIEMDSNIMDVVMKSIDIMGSKISERNLKMSDFVLDVYTDKVGLMDYKKLDKCYEYGYDAVKRNWESIRSVLEI